MTLFLTTPHAGTILCWLMAGAAVFGLVLCALAVADALGGDWRPEKPMRDSFATRNRNRRKGTRFPPTFWRGLGVM